MSERGTPRGEAVSAECFTDDGYRSRQWSHDHVLTDADAHQPEKCLSLPFPAARALPLEPTERPHPLLDVHVLDNLAELLSPLCTRRERCRARVLGGGRRRGEVGEEEREEGGDNDCLVAVAYELEVQRCEKVVLSAFAQRWSRTRAMTDHRRAPAQRRATQLCSSVGHLQNQ